MPPKDGSEKISEFTIKIHQQLVELNSRYEMLAHDLTEKHNQLYNELQQQKEYIKTKVEKIEELLNGNGTPEKGIVVRLDRLEQSEARRTWLMRATITTSIGAIVAAIVNWLKTK